MFVACGIWCLDDVLSVSPSSEQTGCILLLFSSTPRNEMGDMPRENCQTVSVTL